MSSLNTIMGIAKSGLSASQAAISVTSENIANVDTTGYSRQSVNFAESYTINTGGGTVGTGVWAQNVQRYYDQYVENQYYDQSTLSSRWEALYTKLSNTESLFNESSGYGLSDTLESFFTAWNDLTGDATDSSLRNSVLSKSQTLVSTLNNMYSDLQTQSQEADTEINQQVSEVNDLLAQLATLNKQIASTSANTNSLQDERSTLVRSLATYMDINYISNSDGTVTVTTQAGQTLVSGSDYFTISYDGPQATSALTGTSSFDGSIYFSGSDTQEYTFQCITSGAAYGSNAAVFRVSVDGGATWLTNEDGSEQHVYARSSSNAATVGELSVWFGSSSDALTAASTSIAKGDKFTITPMNALYWNSNTSTKENITPYTKASGSLDTSRLTGGTLSALCSYKYDYLGAYEEKLNSLSYSLAWEVNKIHSQGTGLTGLTSVTGTYSVKHDSMALGSGSSGLAYASKLTSGTSYMYVYNTSTGLLVSGASLDFGGGLNFNPATDSLEDVRDAVNNTFGSYLSASIVNHKLVISAKDGYNFAMGTDTTGLYAALGLNTYFTGSTATDLGINTAVSANQSNICAGHVDSAGAFNTGDTTTATAISTLADTKVTMSTLRDGTVSQTLGGFYSGLVSQVGSDVSQSEYKYEYTTALASDLNDQQQAVSGVNLDEEWTNLIKYQHAYTAAAKLISTADQMFQTLLGLKS